MLRLRTVRFIGILLAFVMAASIFIGSPKTAKAATTIYVPDNYPTIQAAVDAASAGDTIIVRDGTYTENITLDKSITIKGEGMPVLDGSGVSSVITIIADGCTIDGFKITGGPPTWWLEAGIKVLSDNNTILNNVAENNGSYGIALFESNYNLLSNNVVENNAGGILLANSSHSILRHNIMNNQHYDFGVQHYDFGVPGEYLCYYLHDIDASNTVAGRPIYYLVDVEDRVLDSSTNAGYIGIVNSTNIVVKDLTLAHNRQGILFAWVQNSRIENINASNNEYGIQLYNSSGNTLSNNTLSSNSHNIEMVRSSSNTLVNNNMQHGWNSGIVVRDSSSNNTFSNNNVSDVNYGIGLSGDSSENTITRNILNNNLQGIGLYNSSANVLNSNIISNNDCGIYLQLAENNILSYNILSTNQSDIALQGANNNFIYLNNLNTSNSVSISNSTNTWNSPEEITYRYSGRSYTRCPGNYWSDYSGSDADGDGIGDTPYPIDSANDNYPLMEPFENYSPASAPDWRRDIEPGDILYDETFSFFSALVFKVISFGQHTGMYLGCGRTIEARLGHVVDYYDISSWDYPKRDRVYLLRVKNCTESIKDDAIQFEISQLGKPYYLSLLNKNSSPDSPNWYCSELDWAAYYDQGNGINIEDNATNSAFPEGWPPDADGKFNNSVMPWEIFGDEDIDKVGWHVPGQGEPYVIVFVICPVDLTVTDPQGLTISKNSNQLTGAIYMQDDFNNDGSPDDLIYIPGAKTGIYSIQVIPEPGVNPNDTFSLEVSINGRSIVLANNVQIKDIPGGPYLVQVTESGQVFVITGPSLPPPPTGASRVSPSTPRTMSPPSLSLQYLNVNPQQASAGQPVTITTNVVNTGDEAGNFNVALKINGQVEQTRMISVGPHGTQPVKFTTNKSQLGTYTVDIGEQRGSFIVLGADNKVSGLNKGDGLLVILSFGILAMAIVVIVMLARRRA